MQTRKLATGCSKYSFEVADKTDEVSSKHCFEVVTVSNYTLPGTVGKATLTWFEEIFDGINQHNLVNRRNLFLPFGLWE